MKKLDELKNIPVLFLFCIKICLKKFIVITYAPCARPSHTPGDKSIRLSRASPWIIERRRWSIISQRNMKPEQAESDISE